MVGGRLDLGKINEALYNALPAHDVEYPESVYYGTEEFVSSRNICKLHASYCMFVLTVNYGVCKSKVYSCFV